MMWFVFFFKQKTAYEMRISDWSSDVCSSDLHATHGQPAEGRLADLKLVHQGEHVAAEPVNAVRRRRQAGQAMAAGVVAQHAERPDERRPLQLPHAKVGAERIRHHQNRRSEEHTPELQSLMRISYAVFCLKKKIRQTKK